MYCRRVIDVCSGDEVKRHPEIDVLTHRVPDRAVFFARQADGALNDGGGHVALDREVQCDSQKAVGILLRAIADQPRPDRPRRTTPSGKHVSDVNGHAAGQRQAERVDRRRPRRSSAVDDQAGPRRRGKLELVDPDEIDDSGWLGRHSP